MHVTLGELAPDGGDVGEPALAGAAIEPELDGERRIAEQRQLLGHVGAGGVGAGGAETSCHTCIMQKGCYVVPRTRAEIQAAGVSSTV